MTTLQEIQNADIRETFTRPVAQAPPDIMIISHSNIFYWWPAWVSGFSAALISYTQGRDVSIVPEIVERVHPSNNPGIFIHRSSRLAHRLHHHQTSRHLLCRHSNHSRLFRGSVRVVWMVGQHPAFHSPALGTREHGLLPLVLDDTAGCLAACLLRI